MTHTELKTALKSFQAQNYPIPPLNSRREVLESALAELQAMTTAAEVTIAPIEETIEVTPAAVVEAPEVAIVPEPEPAPQRIRPEHPAISELREYARLTEITLILGIALVRSIIRFATPHLIRAGGIALRIAIAAAVIFQIWIAPKIQLRSYQLGLWLIPRVAIVVYTVGCWVLTIALWVRSRRGVAIA